jgi:hypothetical protein
LKVVVHLIRAFLEVLRVTGVDGTARSLEAQSLGFIDSLDDVRFIKRVHTGLETGIAIPRDRLTGKGIATVQARIGKVVDIGSHTFDLLFLDIEGMFTDIRKFSVDHLSNILNVVDRRFVQNVLVVHLF